MNLPTPKRASLFLHFALLVCLGMFLPACSATWSAPELTTTPFLTNTVHAPTSTRVSPSSTPTLTNTAVPPTLTPIPSPTPTQIIPSPTLAAFQTPPYITTTNVTQLILQARQPAGQSASFAFSSDSQFLAFGNDSSVVVWDLYQGQIIQVLSSSDEQSRFTGDITFSHDGKLIAAIDRDRQVDVWNLESGSLRLQVEGESGSHLQSVLFSPDSQKVIAASASEGSLAFWDIASGEMLSRQVTGSGGESNLLPHPSGRFILSTGQDGFLRFWDPKSEEVIKTRILYICPSDVPATAFTPNGYVLAIECVRQGADSLESEVYLYQPNLYQIGNLQFVGHLILECPSVQIHLL